MPIGSSKAGILGGKSIVPGGSQTFNAPGTFTVPLGVTIVSVTGRGGTGNPGNSGTAGNPGSSGGTGNPGVSGGGGGGGSGGMVQYQQFPWCYSNEGVSGWIQNQNEGQGGTGGGPTGGGGGTGIYWPVPGQGQLWYCNPSWNCPYYESDVNLQNNVLRRPGSSGGTGPTGSPGPSGAAGNPGSAGNPGNTGAASSVFNSNFAGGAGGNGGSAGSGGSPGAGGPGGSGGSGGPGGAGGSVRTQRSYPPAFPGPIPQYFSGCGAPANPAGGAAGTNGGGYYKSRIGGWYGRGGGGAGTVNAGRGGQPLLHTPQIQNAYPPFFNINSDWISLYPPNPGPGPFWPNTNCAGGSVRPIGGNCGGGIGGCPSRYLYCPLNPTNSLQGRPGNVAGAGGGGGAGYSSPPNSPTQGFPSGGGAGGGRGNPGNPGSGGSAGGSGNPGGAGNPGSAANPSTVNSIPVSPGSPYPVTVGSPGGQIVINWDPQ